MELLDHRIREEGNAIQMTAASPLSPAVTLCGPSFLAFVPGHRNAVVHAAFMEFSHSKSIEDKRPLCGKRVTHRITTGLGMLRDTLLLFISIIAFAKLLPKQLGGTRVNTV